MKNLAMPSTLYAQNSRSRLSQGMYCGCFAGGTIRFKNSPIDTPADGRNLQRPGCLFVNLDWIPWIIEEAITMPRYGQITVNLDLKS